MKKLGNIAIVVESSLVEVLHHPSGLHPSAILGSVAAWTRRGFPVVFAGSPSLAAQFTQRFLTQQITEAQKMLAAISQAPEEPAIEPERTTR